MFLLPWLLPRFGRFNPALHAHEQTSGINSKEELGLRTRPTVQLLGRSSGLDSDDRCKVSVIYCGPASCEPIRTSMICEGFVSDGSGRNMMLDDTNLRPYFNQPLTDVCAVRPNGADLKWRSLRRVSNLQSSDDHIDIASACLI